MNERMDVPYAAAYGRDVRLDIYGPSGEKNQRTAVLMFHGGGWRRGDRKNLATHARMLAKDGFTAIPVQYRLIDDAPWPAALHDVKAAIRWTREHATELDIDPAQIVLEGFSAGGHLALVAAGTAKDGQFEEDPQAATSADVAAVVAFYPPARFHAGETRERGSTPASALLGDAPDDESARLASPVTHIKPGYPPVFLLHGTADRVTPVSASLVLYEALKEAGVDTDLHLLSRQNHGFDSIESFREVVLPEISLFLRRIVSDRARIDAQTIEQSMFARMAAEAAAKGAAS